MENFVFCKWGGVVRNGATRAMFAVKLLKKLTLWGRAKGYMQNQQQSTKLWVKVNKGGLPSN